MPAARRSDSIVSIETDAANPAPTRLRRAHLVWLVPALLAIVASTLLDGPAERLLDRMGWIDRDESFTELYFTQHLSLPRTVEQGSTLAFDVSIRNREGEPAQYRWQVSAVPDASSAAPIVLDEGELRLGDDEVGVVHIAETIDLAPGDVEVEVVLLGRPEAIDFPLTVDRAT